MRFLNVQNRAILSEMVRTNFKVRYQGSILGYLWSLLKPLALFGIIYAVFNLMGVGDGVDYFAVYLLIGIVLWNFFTEATVLGASSIVANGSLIRKVNIPKYLIVIASSLSALINLGFSFLVIIIFALFSGAPIGWSWLLMVPVTLELFILATGISFLLATLYVKFRDVSYIWEIMLQAGFYASGIIFPISSIPVQYQKFLFLNPIVQVVQDARKAILYDTEVVTLWNSGAGWRVMTAVAAISLFATFFGAFYFKRQSKYFAERI